MIALPLKALALAFARLADSTGLERSRADAIARLRAAVAAEPFMIAGTGRLCTDLAATLGQTVLAKVGAEGVYAAAVGNLGYGVAIKIDDGTTRAAETALLAVLDHLGVIDDRQRAALGEWMTRPIRNRANRIVGHVQARTDWLD